MNEEFFKELNNQLFQKDNVIPIKKDFNYKKNKRSYFVLTNKSISFYLCVVFLNQSVGWLKQNQLDSWQDNQEQRDKLIDYLFEQGSRIKKASIDYNKNPEVNGLISDRTKLDFNLDTSRLFLHNLNKNKDEDIFQAIKLIDQSLLQLNNKESWELEKLLKVWKNKVLIPSLSGYKNAKFYLQD